MKAPTTWLAERAVSKQSAPSDGLAVWREAARQHTDEAVVDACLFSRRSSYAANLVARETGFLAQMALRKRREIQAGGLPPHFLLVVTPTDVVAFRRTVSSRARTGTPGEEVARWRRGDLQVSWTPGGYTYDVVLESPGEGERVECAVGKSPLAEDFLALLADPGRSTPAGA